jgi:lysozyme
MNTVYDIESIAETLTFEEGYRRFAYEDHLGYTTVGVGRCIEQGVGYGIDEEEAQWLLKRDVARVFLLCSREFSEFWSDLSPNIREVIILLVFQMGLTGYSKFKNHLAAVRNGDWQAAAYHLLDSKFARQTPERAERMAARIREG